MAFIHTSSPFVSYQEFPLATPIKTQADAAIIDPKPNFENKTQSLVGQETSKAIQKIFDGNVAAINDLFLAKQMNPQTILMKKIIKKILLNPTEVTFDFSGPNSQIKVIVDKQAHLLYPLLAKVKWDLITLSQDELDAYVKECKQYRYTYGTANVPNCNNPKKRYLYQQLHDAEKMAISVYKSSGSTLNSFLRQKAYTNNHQHFCEMIAHVAVLASALNRIPHSVDGYLYRCMSDSTHCNGVGLIADICDKLKKQETFKELGFTSLSLDRPLTGFMYGSEKCLKIYQNPKNMAKDISGLGGFEHENECLFLPNVKDRPIREIKFTKEEDYSKYLSTTHVFLTRVVSKRQGVF